MCVRISWGVCVCVCVCVCLWLGALRVVRLQWFVWELNIFNETTWVEGLCMYNWASKTVFKFNKLFWGPELICLYSIYFTIQSVFEMVCVWTVEAQWVKQTAVISPLQSLPSTPYPSCQSRCFVTSRSFESPFFSLLRKCMSVCLCVCAFCFLLSSLRFSSAWLGFSLLSSLRF